MTYWSLRKRREIWTLTWQGWLLALVIMGASFVFLGRHIYPFLATNSPTHGEILVIEGWLPDYALSQAITLLNDHNYQLIVTTGGPLLRGSYLSEYSTYAELTAAALRQLGVKPGQLVSVPAAPVRTDRTFASALAFKSWLSQSSLTINALDVVSVGPHARRTQLLFQMAVGDEIPVGVIAVPSDEYDADDWWTWSSGVRAVISEAVAYLYARFVFTPPDADKSQTAPAAYPAFLTRGREDYAKN
ncbi:MAG: YdcF family protein [Gammaproteobacteria bacterium]|nr:YdcF family protein [Gammaproteobacteria bacterium]